jgi:predicted porin
MEKKLLTVAIAAALAGATAVAQADTTLYGNLNESINYSKVDDAGTSDPGAGGADNDDDWNMRSNTSSLGVRGSEDLGNGLSAIYQAEWQFDPADASGFTGRDQWLGLSTNKLGKIRFGTISTSYKSHGAMIDPLYRTSLQDRNFGLQSRLHSGKGENGEGRMTRHIRYDSPSWAGFDFTLDYSLDNDANDFSDDNAYGAGVKYKNGGILVFADYLTNDAGGDDNAWKVGGSWTFGNFGIYGQYEGDGGLIAQQGSGANVALTGGYDPDDNPQNWQGDGQNTWFAGLSYTWGNTLFFGGYGQADDVDSGGNNSLQQGIDTGYTSWTIALDHHLSKRTDVYAGYNRLDCNSYSGSVCSDGRAIQINVPADQVQGGGTQDFFSVGMRHKF